MPESTAQFTAPEAVPQSHPVCEFCGTEIVLDPNLRECCHKQAAVHHTLQLDSARNASRHIIVLHKQVDALTERVEALEQDKRDRDAIVAGRFGEEVTGITLRESTLIPPRKAKG